MPAGRRAVNKKKNMPNKLSFGQRIAVVWQELVEHLNNQSTADDIEGEDNADDRGHEE